MPVKPGRSRPRDAAQAADEAATVIASGLQEVGAEVTSYAEDTVDQAMHLARSLIDAASLADVIALQGKFARENFAALLAGSARVTEIGLRTGAALLEAAAPPPRDPG